MIYGRVILQCDMFSDDMSAGNFTHHVTISGVFN